MPRKRKGVTAAQQRERLKRQHNSTIAGQLQSDQGEPELVSPINEPEACKVMSGTFHQGHTRFQYPGIQCAYISLIALIRMTRKDPQLWTSGHIDSCLIDGNSMFLKHCEALDMQPKMLMANELPRIVHFTQTSFVCSQSESDNEVGLLKPDLCDANQCVAKSIEKAILERLDTSQTCLLFCGGQTIAIAKVKAHYYAFDPHSRGKDGLLDPIGTAVLMVFEHLNALVYYIEMLFMGSLKLGPAEQFELVPLNISQQSIESPEDVPKSCSETVEIPTALSTNTSETRESISDQKPHVETGINNLGTPESIESYFEDQKRRQKLFQESHIDKTTTKSESKRNEYMKNYMKRRRAIETIRKKENDSTRSRMQNIRCTSEGRQTNRERSAEGMRKFIETDYET